MCDTEQQLSSLEKAPSEASPCTHSLVSLHVGGTVPPLWAFPLTLGSLNDILAALTQKNLKYV